MIFILLKFYCSSQLSLLPRWSSSWHVANPTVISLLSPLSPQTGFKRKLFKKLHRRFLEKIRPLVAFLTITRSITYHIFRKSIQINLPVSCGGYHSHLRTVISLWLNCAKRLALCTWMSPKVNFQSSLPEKPAMLFFRNWVTTPPTSDLQVSGENHNQNRSPKHGHRRLPQ